jgi:hypothetical protein
MSFPLLVQRENPMFVPPRLPSPRAAILPFLLILCTALVAAQDSPVYSRTRAIDESHSQAARQAEQDVSLSAEKLIALLQRETGLLLEVKKLLVRKAFEQGRDARGVEAPLHTRAAHARRART